MDKLTLHALAIKVQAMRKAQKQYFAQAGKASRTKVPADRADANETKAISIALEKGVDEMVDIVLLADPNEKNQLELIGLLAKEARKVLSVVYLDEDDSKVDTAFRRCAELLEQIRQISDGEEVTNG